MISILQIHVNRLANRIGELEGVLPKRGLPFVNGRAVLLLLVYTSK